MQFIDESITDQWGQSTINEWILYFPSLITIISLPSFIQPSPHRRDERPVSCYTPSSNSHLQAGLGPGPGPGLGSAGLAKDKQRGYMPNMVNNETYGTILSGSGSSQQPGTTSAPPLPPRNLGEWEGGRGGGRVRGEEAVITSVTCADLFFLPKGEIIYKAAWISPQICRKMSQQWFCLTGFSFSVKGLWTLMEQQVTLNDGQNFIDLPI